MARRYLYKTQRVESRDKQRKWRRQLQNILYQLKDSWIVILTMVRDITYVKCHCTRI
jgi:hypothetical protein